MRNKTRNFIFSALCLLPMLLCVCACFTSGTFDIATLDTSLNGVLSWDWFDSVVTYVLDTFLAGTTGNWPHFLVSYFVWLLMVACVDMLFVFFLKIIDIFRALMDRIGGKFQ